MTSRLLLFLLLFYGALAAGWVYRGGRAWSPRLMRWTILFLEPWLFFYSLWALDPAQLRLFAPVPLAAVALILISLAATPHLARRWLADRPAQGSFILAASFSNIGGTGGAFLCYLLFGLPGLSLAYLFLVPYPFLIFSLGFGLARRYGTRSPGPSGANDLLAPLRDPISALPLLAMGLGVLCRSLGTLPPPAAAPVADLLIKADLAVMCFAIGMTVTWPDWRLAWRPSLANAAIKYLASPALGLVLAWLAYGSLTSLPAKVLIVESAMPSAIYAVVTANLFGLDRDLANVLWISSTLLLAPVALVLFLLLG